MRIAYMTNLILAAISWFPPTLLADENQGRDFTAAGNTTLGQQHAPVAQRIDAMRQKLDEHMRILRLRLADAQQMRQTALQSNDQRMLNRAEQLEREAIAHYQRQVEQTEQGHDAGVPSNVYVPEARLQSRHVIRGVIDFEFPTLAKTQWNDTSLARLPGSTDLQRLDLAQSPVTDAGLAHLRGFTNLEELSLYSTMVSDAGLYHLRQLTNLRWLDLRYTRVTDAGLVHLQGMTELQELWLDGTRVTDAGLVRLGALSKLRRLRLDGTQVSDLGMPRLVGLTELQFLDLARTAVSDAGLVHLRTLTTLTALGLEDTQVTDAGVQKLRMELPNCRIFH